jgi:hypothetical protein
MAEFEQCALQFAIAPTRIFLGQASQEFFDLGIRFWTTHFAALGEGPLAADEVAAPAQDGVGFEQEQHLVQLGFSVAPQAKKFAGKDSQGELLPARNAGCLRMVSLEDAQLLAQQQDFEVLIALGAASDGEEVEQQQDDLSKKKVEHRLTACMSCAGPRVPGRCRSRAAHSAAVRIFRTLQGRKSSHPALPTPKPLRYVV